MGLSGAVARIFDLSGFKIDNLVKKKSKIAGDLSPKGSYLNQLIEERKKYENSLNSGAEYVKAPMSGIVSYKVDGFEETLTTQNFETLSKEYLESLDLKTGKVVATSDECGKVIDNFNCYIATITSSEEAKQAEVGKKIKIRLLHLTFNFIIYFSHILLLFLRLYL